MKQLKAASLSRSLLLLKGRTNPAALVDEILGEVGIVSERPRSAAGNRAEPSHQFGGTRERAEAAVVMPWRNTAPDLRRPVLENLQRKKLSLRLDRVRHFRLKLVAYHLGISAQELLTRALESYIEHVAPEMARTKPMAATELKPAAWSAPTEQQTSAPATRLELRSLPEPDSDTSSMNTDAT
jgi:hypothetical protein